MLIDHYQHMIQPTIRDERPSFMKTGQFARMTNLSTATVKRLCDAGDIAHVIISERGDRRIPASEVDRLLAEAQATREERLTLRSG